MTYLVHLNLMHTKQLDSWKIPCTTKGKVATIEVSYFRGKTRSCPTVNWCRSVSRMYILWRSVSNEIVVLCTCKCL